MKNIIYIGNNLKSSNPTTLLLLSGLLKKGGYNVLIYSHYKNNILRLINMCWGVLTNKDANYILIDTYSTLNFYYALVISQLARILNILYIPILHGGNLPNRLKSNPRYSNLIFNHSFINVAPSNYLKTEFEKNNYKTIFISNAIDIRQYVYKERIEIQTRLLWVRAFDEIYNPQMAIEVLAVLKKKYPFASLCMVGPDKDGSLDSCKKLAVKLNVLDSIEFTGLLPKNEWIDKSTAFDIFINTTNIDNTPVSVIEAMALGLPVVSTNVGGLPYLIEENINGLLIAKNDIVEMSQKIIELLENPLLVLEISRNARSTVENFDIEKGQQQWIKLLKR